MRHLQDSRRLTSIRRFSDVAAPNVTERYTRTCVAPKARFLLLLQIKYDVLGVEAVTPAKYVVTVEINGALRIRYIGSSGKGPL